MALSLLRWPNNWSGLTRCSINTEFLRIEAFRDHCLPIDFSGTREAMATNLATRRQALEDLRKGVTLLAFPAGTVATAPRVFGRAQEAAWKTFTAGLVQKARRQRVAGVL